MLQYTIKKSGVNALGCNTSMAAFCPTSVTRDPLAEKQAWVGKASRNVKLLVSCISGEMMVARLVYISKV